jgi:hypothetical protein
MVVEGNDSLLTRGSLNKDILDDRFELPNVSAAVKRGALALDVRPSLILTAESGMSFDTVRVPMGLGL